MYKKIKTLKSGVAVVIIFSMLVMTYGFVACSPAKSSEILLWPDVAPGSEGLTITEQITDNSKDGKIPDRNITGVTKPTITAFFSEKSTGASMLVIPGGSFNKVVIDKEGVEVAKWLNSIGINAFVLKYRLLGPGQHRSMNVPLSDAMRALKLIRSKAADWNVDPQKIGVIGFSAGGNLASMLGTRYDENIYNAIDDIDAISSRPDFMVLVYPWMPKGDLKVLKDTPQTFIAAADDDKTVPVDSNIRFYNALKSQGISGEMHIFRTGGHGFALRNDKGPVTAWADLCHEWLIDIGIFK